MFTRTTLSLLVLCVCFAPRPAPAEETAAHPHPIDNPGSPVMLVGPWVPEDPHDLDFHALPRIPSAHALVSDVRDAAGTRVNQHNYLAHHDGRFWAMWSDGPGAPREGLSAEEHRGVVPGHDREGQWVSFATSEDGLAWTQPANLTGMPDEGFGWIARGFWLRDGQLLALASRYEAPGYSGGELDLHAFRRDEDAPETWQHHSLVFADAINNFPPKRLPTGEWMMSRRDHLRDVHTLVGGTEAVDAWESFPMVAYQTEALGAEEPYWWILPDNNLIALFRDNRRSGYLFRAFSTDNARTWSQPVRTDFPDARSKFSGLRLRDGRYVLVSNPNPEVRNPMTLSVSEDGLVFHKMGFLVGSRHVDYPHVIEHEDHLYVAFATAKQTVEVLKIALSDVDALEMPETPITKE